jgi:hypothetical protein
MAATKAENQLGYHFFDLSVAQCIGRIFHGRDSGLSAACR